ncbi:hypothetical protein HY640_00305 [Candidatus Woesearchaeota archaeon]|nr:hypothetical protein [Candidatus Woesearchaeota archaeon]
MGFIEFLGKTKTAAIIFFIASAIILLPVFRNPGYMGFYDWDQHFFYHGSAEITIKKFGQFPLWNPFYCGGNPALANPQSPFLSPFFILVLLFGAVKGLKVQILLYLFLGLLGMFLLARHLGIKVIQSYFAASLFMLSSWHFSRILVGHTTFFPFALMPWAMFFYLKSHEDKRFIALSAITLAVMLLSGAVYPLYFTGLLIGLYSVMQSIEQKSPKPLIMAATIIVAASLASAIKLLPMIAFAHGLSNPDTQQTSLTLTIKALLSRNQDIDLNDQLTGRASITELDKLQEATLTGQVAWGWHEYSAYIGIIPMLLLLVSALNYRKNWKLLILATLFLLLSLGDSSPMPLWGIIKSLPLVGALHGPSRLLILFVFCASLLAAKALSDIKPINHRYVASAALILVTADLLLVSQPALAKTFQVEPFEIKTEEFDQYIHMLSLNKYLSQYQNMLQNIDTVNCYERVHLKIRARPQFFDTGEPFEGFIGNAYITETNQTLTITKFSPNKVTIETNGTNGTAVYNQNYYPGWKADGKSAEAYNGLVSTQAGSQKQITFYYGPGIFYLGAAITALTIAGLVYMMAKWRQ